MHQPLSLCHPVAAAPEQQNRPLAAPGPILKIFNSFLADQKNMVFWHRTKTSKKADTIDPVRPMSEKMSKKSTVGLPFYIDFSIFSKTCKSTSGAYSFTLSMVLYHQKPFISDKKIVVFSCFFRAAPVDRF
jgi:hypothetical protein